MILGRPGPPGRIAVVHVDADLGEETARLLRPAGHRVQVHVEGPGVVRQVVDGAPDLLVGSAALTNPPLGGVVRAVRHALGELPVVVLMGEGARDTLVEADEMVREPALAGELNLRVGTLLRARSELRGLQRRARDLQGLWKLSWALSLEAGAESFYGHLTRQAAEMLHAERALALLYDPEDRAMVGQRQAFGYSPGEVDRARWAIGPDARSRWNFRKNGPLVSNHAEGDPRLVPELVHQLGFRSVAMVPLARGGRVLGLLVVANRVDGRFAEEDLQLLLGVANGATVGVENLRLHHDLMEANELLKEYDRLKNEFVAMVAHDFRRPLMAIRGFAELLLEEPDLPTETRDEYMRTVMAETDGLARLADDTLLITRIETGEFQFQWREVELGPFVLDCMPLGLHDRSVLAEVPESVPRIVTDPDRLRQVLTNLISNALKYSPPGEAVKVRCQDRGDGFVAIEVIDRGLGIPAEDMGRLFQKFARVRTAAHLGVQGTGLGLYICRLIVEGMGGQVWVDSELGKGSTFGFTVPLDGSRWAAAPPPGATETVTS